MMVTRRNRRAVPVRKLTLALLSLAVFAQETEAEFAAARKAIVNPLMNQYRYAEAEKSVRALLAKAESKLPPGALEIGWLQDLLRENLTLLRQAESDEALRLAESALRIFKQHTGVNSKESTEATIELSKVYANRFEFDVAAQLLEPIIEGLEKTEASNPRLIHAAQLELGAIQFNAGAFGKLKRTAERALAFAEKQFGPESAEVAYLLTQLGFGLKDLGDPPGAALALTRSLRIREAELGPEHRLTIASMNNLAIAYAETGEFDKSRALYERANAARRKLLGPDNPDNALGLGNLGNLLFEAGDFVGARKHLTEALELRARTVGKDSFLYSQSQWSLARVLWRLNELPAAREHVEQALQVYQKALSPEHPFLVQIYVTLAGVLASQKDNEAAFRAAREAATRWTAMTRLSAQTVPERFASAARDPLHDNGLGLATSLALIGSDIEKRDAFDLWIRSRAIVLDEMSVRQKTLNRSAAPEAELLRAKMVAARSRVARLTLNGGPGLVDAKAARDAAESDYAELNRDMRSALRRARVGLDEVAGQLKPGDVLVAYAVASDATSKAKRLAAFVLPAGKAVPAMVPIGPVTEVDRSVKRWRQAISEVARDPARAGIRAEAAAREAGAALRRLVYDPVSARFGNAQRVYLVAEGTLQLVNFSALPLPNGRYLIEGGPLLEVLPTERDIVPDPEDRQANSGMLAIGNPAFGERRGSASEGCADLRTVRFEPLPSTAEEISELSKLWRGGGAVVVQGQSASEDAFRRQVQGKRVVHVATHGFFLPGHCAKEGGPLVASGLALAGANRRPKDGDDGLLTAEEVAGLNMDGVEWVVLSGCNTGLGEVKDSEGVFGLRRAFRAAGAATVIMSLWPVEDKAARDWMRSLYTAKFQRGMSTAQSLRAAGREMLASRRAAGLSAHPYFWAAFVGAGAK